MCPRCGPFFFFFFVVVVVGEDKACAEVCVCVCVFLLEHVSDTGIQEKKCLLALCSKMCVCV